MALRGSKYQETGIIFIIRRFTTCSPLQISFGLPNPGKMRQAARGMREDGRNVRCTLGGKTGRGRFECKCVDGRIILKWI